MPRRVRTPNFDSLGFDLSKRDSGATEVVPTINGRKLTELIEDFERHQGFPRPGGHGGLIPAHFRFGSMRIHFVAGPGSVQDAHGSVPVLGCDCGEWGCNPFYVRVGMTATTVTWKQFNYKRVFTTHTSETLDHRRFGPFTFERRQFEAATAALELALLQAD